MLPELEGDRGRKNLSFKKHHRMGLASRGWSLEVERTRMEKFKIK
jgi:hypothetical protein